MKEQVQETGVRKWFGDDFIDLQTELRDSSLAALFNGFTECVISGGTVTNNGDGTYTIAEGIAWLRNNLGQNGKICRFYSQTFPGASFPVYLVQASRDKDGIASYGRLYKDGVNKNVIVEYYGRFESVNPGHGYYAQYTTAGVNRRWRDAVQDSSYKFVTDTEKNTWNAKAPTANPVFTGTVQGVTKAHVGLGNVANESKATMFTNPVFTGNAGITGSSGNAVFLRVTNPEPAGHIWRIGDGNYSHGLFSIYNETNNQFSLNITGDGKVGIGTPTPFANLTLTAGVSTGWEYGGHSSSRRWWTGNDKFAYGDFHISTESTQGRTVSDLTRIYISSSGDIGIGNSSPGQKLDVSGAIKCTDIIIA